MCLSVLALDQILLLEEGQIDGYEYAITHNPMGYRCGYLKVLPSHPWHGQHYMDLCDISVHWGLTFAAADEPCDKAGADDGWWLGFDCAHGGDAPDPALVTSDYRGWGCHSGVVRSTEYVKTQLEGLAAQAAAAI